jgi:hypothetical protein
MASEHFSMPKSPWLQRKSPAEWSHVVATELPVAQTVLKVTVQAGATLTALGSWEIAFQRHQFIN